MSEKRKELEELFPEIIEEEYEETGENLKFGFGHERDLEEVQLYYKIKSYIDNYKSKMLKSRIEEKKKITEQNFRYDIIEKLNNFEILLEKFISTNEELITCITDSSEDVEEAEVQEIQDLPDEIVEEIIIEYLKNNPDKTVFPSDVAFAFNLDAFKIFEISERMREEGKIV